MKYVLAAILSISVLITFAQDSLRVATRVDSLFGQIDSLSSRQSRLMNKLDTLKSPFGKVDSLRSGILSTYDKSTAIVTKTEGHLSGYTSRITSLQLKLTSRIDSLSSLPKPDRELIAGLDSLRLKLEDLKSGDAAQGARDAVGKVQSVTGDIETRIGSVEKKINDKLGLFSSNGAPVGTVDLPGINGSGNIAGSLNKLTGEHKLPSLQGKIPETDLKAPSLKTGSVDTSIPGMEKVNQALNAPKEKLSEVTKTNGLNNISGKMEDVKKISQQVEGYSKDAKAIAQNNMKDIQQLPETLEKKIENMDAMKEVKEHMGDYSEMVKKWNSDPDVMKQMALAKAKEQAVNHFAGHEAELNAGMEQLSKIKSKTKDVEAVIDIFGKRTNTMRGKGVERLLPGCDLQIQISDHQWLDFNAHLGFRFTSRLTAGAGWTERAAASVKERTFISSERAYGPRGFVEFKLKENFHLKAEADLLNASVRPMGVINPSDPVIRAWVWSWFAGIKKSFSLSPEVRGNVQVLYNLYNPDNRSPYMSRLNVRTGIELPLRRKQGR